MFSALPAMRRSSVIAFLDPVEQHADCARPGTYVIDEEVLNPVRKDESGSGFPKTLSP